MLDAKPEFVYSIDMNRKPLILLLAPLLLLGSCQQQQQPQAQAEEQEEQKSKVPPPLHLGAVHQVYPEQNFALLRIIGPMPGPGVTLITHPADGSNSRIGNLVISTGQPTRNNIIAADIRSGTVVRGDRVFRYRNIASYTEPSQDTEPGQEDMAETVTAADTSMLQEEAELVSNMRDEDFPEPVLNREDDDTQDTVVEEEPEPSVPVTPASPTPQHAAPSYLNDIPDDISQWD